VREINRSILIARPREPYLTWIQSLDEEHRGLSLSLLRDDCTALLVPQIEEPSDAQDFLEQHHAALFEYLLAGWVDEPDVWPERRDLETLREWFDLDFSSLVLDVCEWPLEHLEH
jgi:hypothetical protein